MLGRREFSTAREAILLRNIDYVQSVLNGQDEYVPFDRICKPRLIRSCVTVYRRSPGRDRRSSVTDDARPYQGGATEHGFSSYPMKRDTPFHVGIAGVMFWALMNDTSTEPAQGEVPQERSPQPGYNSCSGSRRTMRDGGYTCHRRPCSRRGLHRPAAIGRSLPNNGDRCPRIAPSLCVRARAASRPSRGVRSLSPSGGDLKTAIVPCGCASRNRASVSLSAYVPAHSVHRTKTRSWLN